jgi:hypothetical protein
MGTFGDELGTYLEHSAAATGTGTKGFQWFFGVKKNIQTRNAL